jgi:hypothetical protein
MFYGKLIRKIHLPWWFNIIGLSSSWESGLFLSTCSPYKGETSARVGRFVKTLGLRGWSVPSRELESPGPTGESYNRPLAKVAARVNAFVVQCTVHTRTDFRKGSMLVSILHCIYNCRMSVWPKFGPQKQSALAPPVYFERPGKSVRLSCEREVGLNLISKPRRQLGQCFSPQNTHLKNLWVIWSQGIVYHLFTGRIT